MQDRRLWKPEGAPEGGHPPARRLTGAARGWPRPLAAWARGGSPLVHLLAFGIFWCVDFLGIFLDFSEMFKFPFFCTQNGHTGSSAENSASPG